MCCRTTLRKLSSNFGKSDAVRLLEQATPAFIQPDLWPQNSPDLKPCQLDLQDAGRRPAASLPVAGASH